MSYTPRPLATATLDQAAADYVKHFNLPSVPSKTVKGIWVGGRSWVMNNLYQAAYKDEHGYLVGKMEDLFDQDGLNEFRKQASSLFTPRSNDVFERELEERLAINPAGEHVPGRIGRVEIGRRVVGKRVVERPILRRARRTGWTRMFLPEYHVVQDGVHIKVKNAYWPVYAGEVDERLADSGVADPLPPDALPFGGGEFAALAPAMSNLAAIDACNAIVDRLDLGSTDGTIRGRDGAQPADVDATETGTLLFTCTFAATAFGVASDDTGKATATAAAIVDDSSADATATVTYCRCGSTGAGADDELDGSAGTSSANFVFNTTSIVTGSTVSITAMTVSVSET